MPQLHCVLSFIATSFSSVCSSFPQHSLTSSTLRLFCSCLFYSISFLKQFAVQLHCICIPCMHPLQLLFPSLLVLSLVFQLSLIWEFLLFSLYCLQIWFTLCLVIPSISVISLVGIPFSFSLIIHFYGFLIQHIAVQLTGK